MPHLPYPRASFFSLTLIAIVLLLTRCLHTPREEQPPVVKSLLGHPYAGDQACRSCHQALYDSMLYTAHYLTSRKAAPEYVAGSFAPGWNEFAFDAHRKVVMEQKDEGMFQTAYVDGKEVASEPFDIVMGSGRKGQTFLYWKDRELFQLPITWFSSVHAWANSPGYTMDRISFERHIESRCMECHTTFAKQLSAYEYDRGTILYGVSCERCHGPAGDHVTWETQHSRDHGAKSPVGYRDWGKFIVNPAKLSRQAKLDVCALCHSGVMRSEGPAFLFQPGDTLSHFFNLNSAHIDSFNLDVHANQYGLLTASRCFRISGTMDCSTCHDPHVRERGDLAAYGTKCLSCHQRGGLHYCRLSPPKGSSGFDMTANCVECHMPVRASHNLTMLAAGRSANSPEWVRTHRIAIYPDVTEGVVRRARK